VKVPPIKKLVLLQRNATPRLRMQGFFFGLLSGVTQ